MSAHERTGIRRAGAFTLVEIMVVVAIMGVVLGIAAPSMYRALRKEGMRKAVSDVIEACQEARAAAILNRRMAVLTVLPETRELRVGFEEENRPAAAADIFATRFSRPQPKQDTAQPAPKYAAQISPGVSVELLDVNFIDHLKSEAARVRFFPNGTCDEFTIVLRSAQNEWRRVSLDVLTGTVELEAWR